MKMQNLGRDNGLKLVGSLLTKTKVCPWRLLTQRGIGVIGVPHSKGQPKHGVDTGPAALREIGLIKDLCRLVGHNVQDHGDIRLKEMRTNPTVGIIKNCRHVGQINEELSGSVRRILEGGEACLVLGGDHSLGMGSIHGHCLAKSKPCVLWVDAHADINTTSTTTTGNMHGMPMSFLIHQLAKNNTDLPGFDWLKPCLSGKDVVFIGLRDVEPMERLILKECGITAFSMRDVDKLGIVEVTARALEAINPRGERPLHVSFDIDSLDPIAAPSTGTSVPGGLTLREGIYLAEEVHKTGKLSVLDLVEVNPLIGSKDDRQRTLLAAKQIIMSFFGCSRAGDLPVGVVQIPIAASIASAASV